MKYKNALLGLLAVCTTACGTLDDLAEPAAGDIWRYSTRPGEESSTAMILKIETVYDMEIVHLRVDGIELRHPDKGVVHDVPFLPFIKSEILATLTEKVGNAEEIPDFSEQYDGWQLASEQRWIWRQSIPHALEGLQDAYDRIMRSERIETD